MTDADLAALIDQYRDGLAAEIAILDRIEATSARQSEATAARDIAALNRAGDDRDALMAALVTVESDLRAVRQTLSTHRDRARGLHGYREASDLHHDAIRLITGILQSDTQSLEALASAELARRETARAMEQGETTLAAYRRVMTTAPGATLVDRRG